MTILRQEQTNIGLGSGSFWTGSVGVITRDSDVQITGSLLAPDITGSLYGTSSWALTASFLLGSIESASYSSFAEISYTASLIDGGFY